MLKYITLVMGTTVAAGLVLSACSAPAPTPVQSGAAEASTAVESEKAEVGDTDSATQTAAAKAGPVNVMSCNEELTFAQAPERVVLLADDAIPYVAALGVADKVVGMGMKVTPGIYPDEVYSAFSNAKELEFTYSAGPAGGVATEAILSVQPDLVIGYDAGADREALAKAGVPLYSPAVWCPDYKVDKAAFDQIDTEIDAVAKIFHMPDKAEPVKADLAKRIATVQAKKQDRGSALAIYGTEAETTFTAYGRQSMVQPMFEALGLTNVFEGRAERMLPGTTMEQILEANPDHIVLLYFDSDPEALKQAFLKVPGASELKAVKGNNVHVLHFNLTDPPSPNSIVGLEKLNELLGP